MLDRLLLDEQRVIGMAQGLREVAELPIPWGVYWLKRIVPAA